MRAVCEENHVEHALPITKNAPQAALADVVDLPRRGHGPGEGALILNVVEHGASPVAGSNATPSTNRIIGTPGLTWTRRPMSLGDPRPALKPSA